jgi:hypothetical protein
MSARFDSIRRVTIFFLLVFSVASPGSNCLATENPPSVGLNKLDLLKQYTGLASGGDGSTRYRRITQAMGRKAIADARDAGVTYLRVSASGFAPSAYNRPGDLDLWRKNPPAYWALVDELMGDMEAAGMRAVFTFIWNPVQFPAMTGETVHDLLTNPQSRSAQLAERYVREFVERYKGRKVLLFYELTNELNLGADLDTVARCKRELPAPQCEPKGNYTTVEMIAFTHRLAELIRGLDPARPISSGFAAPRPAAEHLRAQPEWITGQADFTPDTPEQLRKNLADIHVGTDLISVHLYPNDGNRRFGVTDQRSTALLDAFKQAADKIGKPLFIGEFGDAGGLEGKEDSYTVRLLDRIVALKVPYSAVWVWQFYQTAPYITRDNPHTAYSLEPGVTDVLIAKILDANRRLGNPVPYSNRPDSTPPRVVLTWPLDCTLVSDGQPLHGMASDDSGAVDRVEFWLDDVQIATDSAPPYQATLTIEGIEAGDHTLTARAYDHAGNQNDYRGRVIRGRPSDGSPCLAPAY